MAETLRKPSWWSPDVEFDITGKTQLEWAKEGAERYRELHPERYGVTPPCDTPEIVTPSVTPPAEEMKQAGEAMRKRLWRDKNRSRSREINRAAKLKRREGQE